MRKTLYLGVAITLVMLCAAPLTAAKRKSGESGRLDAVKRGLVDAYNKKDLAKVMSFYAPHFASSSAPTKGLMQQRLIAAFGAEGNTKLQITSVHLDMASPFAQEIVDMVFNTVSASTFQQSTVAGRRVLTYEKCGGRWMITGEEDVDVEGEKGIRGQTCDDPRRGLCVKAPGGWIMRVIRGPETPFVMLTSPDMRSVLRIGRMHLPAQLTAKEVLESQLDEVGMKLVGSKKVSEGPVELGRMKGYQITTDTKLGDRVARVRRSYFVDENALLFVVASADSLASLKAAQSGFETILDTVELTKIKVDPLLGSIKGRLYKNEEFGCEFTLPKGWFAKLEKGSGVFRVSFASRDGVVDGSFVCFRCDKDVSVQLLVTADEYNTSQNSFSYRMVKRGVVTCRSGKGHGTLSAFQLSGKSRVRRRAYFLERKYLFGFLVDVSPPDKYQERAGEINEMIKSLQIEPGRSEPLELPSFRK